MLQLTPGLLAGQGLHLVAHNEPLLQRLLVVDRQLGNRNHLSLKVQALVGLLNLLEQIHPLRSPRLFSLGCLLFTIPAGSLVAYFGLPSSLRKCGRFGLLPHPTVT